MNYWLFKSEPSVYGIHHLKAGPKKTTQWEGVRNYQARNFMRDGCKKGDKVLFYHSNCDTPGIVGVAKVVKEAYPDHFALDKKSKYYDKKATPEKPIWCMVDIKFEQEFKETISLAEMKDNPLLADMLVLRRGNRLSITPVTEAEFNAILAMAK